MPNDLNSFFDEVDDHCFFGRKPDRKIAEQCTRNLLAEADKLLAAKPELMKAVENGNLRDRICGPAYIPETYNNKEYKRAVIDLVQEGGSMFGIGLLGFTYVMERAGVRFRSMAGTSAGAINTLLLAALPDHKIYPETSPFDHTRQAVKSELLAYLVANNNFKHFLDRRGLLGTVQLFLLRQINVIGKLMPLILLLLMTVIVALPVVFYHLLNKGIYHLDNHITENQLDLYNFISATLCIGATLLFLLMVVLAVFNKTMGFNPGKAPYEWMKSILDTSFVGMKTTNDLMSKRHNETRPVFAAVPGSPPEPIPDPRLVIITANLTHNRIVKFPENAKDYWSSPYDGFVCPAAYVRSSMSLPFIFNPLIPHDRYVCMNPAPSNTVQLLARFVDGGMLSNFPIREFHVPPPTRPRYPTFGVLLGKPGATSKQNSEKSTKQFYSLSVFKFILSFISTFRAFYDADFLFDHPEFNLLIKAVDTSGINSLDFGMPDKTKIELFRRGAATAIQQLEEFDWQHYLTVRK